MSFIEIPSTIQEAFRDENWRKAINEEMQALKKKWDLEYGWASQREENSRL